MGITHAFQSSKSDGGDTSVVRPSDWNADHVGGYALISETVLSSDAADITITGIPATYKDLILVFRCRTAKAAKTDDVRLRVGSGSIDTGTNYDYKAFYMGAASASANGVTTLYLGTGAANTMTTGVFSAHEITIPDYATTTRMRLVHGRADVHDASDQATTLFSGAWRNTTQALNQVRVYGDGGDLKAGSSLAVYGRA